MKEKIGILYYSLSGHTRKVAEEIQKAVGGDLIPVKTVKTYPADYNELVEKGQEEVEAGTMPALKDRPDLSAYSFLFAGSPTWWYTMAPAMRTFLTKENLSGKKMAFFTTHEGWPGKGPSAMAALAVKGEALVQGEGLAVRFSGSRQVTSMNDIRSWAYEMQNEKEETGMKG